MAYRLTSFLRSLGTFRRQTGVVTGTILIGAAGVVTSFSCEGAGGSVSGIVKTAAKTGRYTVTFARKFRSVRMIGAPCLIGPADAALTSTDGWYLSVRNLSGTGFDIQASQVSLADANPTNGNSIHFACEVQL